MSTLESKLQPLAATAAASQGVVLVCARMMGGGRHLILQIMVEKPDGSSPTLDICGAVSRHLANMLDEADLIATRYTLEVTSPGMDRPLLKPADYQRFAGRHAAIKFTRPQMVHGLSLGAMDGYLVSADDKSVTLTNGTNLKQNVTIAYTVIRGAELAPTDAELHAVLKTQPKPGHAPKVPLPNVSTPNPRFAEQSEFLTFAQSEDRKRTSSYVRTEGQAKAKKSPVQ